MKAINHPWWMWECYKAGFHKTTPPVGMTPEECKRAYAKFVSNSEEFENALGKVVKEWKFSCEHFLSKSNINHIAWLGQASACYSKGLPACFRGGFNLLNVEQRDRANNLARKYYEIWKKK